LANDGLETSGGQERTGGAVSTLAARKKKRGSVNGARVEIAGADLIGGQMTVLPMIIGIRIDDANSLARSVSASSASSVAVAPVVVSCGLRGIAGESAVRGTICGQLLGRDLSGRGGRLQRNAKLGENMIFLRAAITGLNLISPRRYKLDETPVSKVIPW
jgi:hypothetical protein